MREDTFKDKLFPTPPIKCQRESYCKTTNILTQINLQFNNLPSMSAFYLRLILQTVELSIQELEDNSEIELNDHKRLAFQTGSEC